MTRFDNRSALNSANDLQRALERTGDQGGKALSSGIEAASPKIEKAMDRAANATGKVRVEQEKYNKVLKDYNNAVKDGGGDREKLIVHHERLAKAQRDQQSAMRSLTTVVRDAQTAGETAGMTFTQLGASIGALGRVAGPAAVAGLGVALVNVAGVASAAAGSIGLLPGVIGGAASAFGTLKLATLGFGDALKDMGDPEKFAEDLRQLSPAAQQAALAIQQLMPSFTQLKNATQDALFAGVGPQLQQLTNTLLPTIQQATTGIAGAFNEMFMGVTNQLMTPETQKALQDFTSNLTAALKNLAPAMAPLTDAFAQLASAGSSVLPDMAKGAADLAKEFAEFIRESTRTGQFQEWLQVGLDTLKQFGPIVKDVATMFLQLAPVGERIMPDIVTAIHEMSLLIPPLIDGITRFPSAWQGVAQAIDFAMQATKAFAAVLSPVLDAFGLLGSPQERAERKLSAAQLRAAVTQGFAPTAGPFGGNLPVPMGQPGIGSGLGNGSASMRIQPYTWGNPPPEATKSATSLPDAPSVPYDQTLPAGYAGLPQTAEIVSAENAYMDARHNIAEKEARLNQLRASNTATADDITKAENDVIQARQQQQQAELRLQDAAQNLYQKNTKALKGYADQMGEIGAKLDSDLGITKGLPGIAENLFKFLANLAAAPLEGQLNAIANAPGQAQGGFGLMGILGAQGVFGPQYTYAGQQAAEASSSATGASTTASALGPAALMPSGTTTQAGAPMPGESARDFAHRVMMPFWQSKGLTVGDHAADQYGEHQNGALDIMVPSITAGQQVLQQVLSDPNVYGAIFNNQTYGYGHGPTPQDYSAGHTGNPTQDHQDHVHAWYKPGGSNNINPSGMPIAFSPTTPSGPSGPSVASVTSAPSFPIPLPVTIVGGMGAPGLGFPGITPGAPGAPGMPGPGTPGQAPGTWGGPTSLPGGIVGGGGQGPIWGANPAGPGLGASATAGVNPAQGSPAGSPIGGVEPYAGSGSGGVGMAPGGLLDTGLSMAASGLDMLAPGAGQAAQVGIKLANRAIQYGGQVAGIATQGLMDTFLPTGGSELANRNWFTRILGGIAGAAPALPNMAGKPARDPKEGQQPPGSPASGQGSGPPPGPTQNITVNNQRATEDGTGKDIAYHLQNMYVPAAMP